MSRKSTRIKKDETASAADDDRSMKRRQSLGADQQRRSSMRLSKISPTDKDSDEGSEVAGLQLEELGLLDKNRLVATVPAYESNHMRHYLTDWKQYQKN